MDKSFKRWDNKVSIYPHSIRFHRVASYHPKRDKIAKRGKITGFSRHSRLRLRDLLAKCFVADSLTLGITLTVPWKETNLQSDLEAYKLSWDRFTKSFRRAFPNSAAIFRHELQQRKMPHTHIIAFFSSIDVDTSSDFLSSLQSVIFSLWLQSIQDLHNGSLTGFTKSGVCVQSISDLDAAYRYISDHASKLKQVQLGYSGKQWGCLSRKLLKFHTPSVYRFKNQSTLVRVQREVSKLCRFRVPLVKNLSKRIRRKRYDGFSSDLLKRKLQKLMRCPFGSKMSSQRHGISIQYLSVSTSLKLFGYLSRYDGGIYRDADLPMDKYDFDAIISSPNVPRGTILNH